MWPHEDFDGIAWFGGKEYKLGEDAYVSVMDMRHFDPQADVKLIIIETINEGLKFLVEDDTGEVTDVTEEFFRDLNQFVKDDAGQDPEFNPFTEIDLHAPDGNFLEMGVRSIRSVDHLQNYPEGS